MEQPLPAADSYGVKDSAWFEDVFTKFPRLHHLLSDKVKARLLRLESELAKPFVNDLVITTSFLSFKLTFSTRIILRMWRFPCF